MEENEGKNGKSVWTRICPNCLSPRIRKVSSMSGDMAGSIGWLPWKYECPDCGWTGRLILEKETSVPTDISDKTESGDES